MKYRLFLSLAAAGVLGSTAFAGTMGPVVPSNFWPDHEFRISA